MIWIIILTSGIASRWTNSTEHDLQKLTVPRLIIQLFAPYGTWRFVTVFTTAHHVSLSLARWIHSTSTRPISVTPTILYPHLHLGLPSGVLPSHFPIKMYFSSSLVSVHWVCLLGENCKSWRFSLCSLKMSRKKCECLMEDCVGGTASVALLKVVSVARRLWRCWRLCRWHGVCDAVEGCVGGTASVALLKVVSVARRLWRHWRL